MDENERDLGTVLSDEGSFQVFYDVPAKSNEWRLEARIRFRGANGKKVDLSHGGGPSDEFDEGAILSAYWLDDSTALVYGFVLEDDLVVVVGAKWTFRNQNVLAALVGEVADEPRVLVLGSMGEVKFDFTVTPEPSRDRSYGAP
ncbi:MAG: hypothetical protein HKN03_09620 [Acidimicrobiales bacterium]|nr:hypothetical protein [Acidimicrobiia bacterium]NNF54684.1 hypothetical protein [Acidimicrobiales bacterium]NNL48987.1 hypothetical protein [Acidimicrobiia bacterium]